MRLRGFSGSDPTFLAISISLALTVTFSQRAWVYRECWDMCLAHLVATVVAALLLRPRSRVAWIACALTALLTWRYFTTGAYRNSDVWLLEIPHRVVRPLPMRHRNILELLVLLLLYVGPIVVATAAVRPDLRASARAARVVTALAASIFLWTLAWAFVPLRYPLNPYAMRYLQVGVYLLPSVATPLLIWRLMLVRRPELPWIGAAVTTLGVPITLFAFTGRANLRFLAEYPVDCFLLAAFALAGPAWAYRDWSAHRRSAETHGFDVILSSSATPQR